jgi:hypothetical protein
MNQRADGDYPPENPRCPACDEQMERVEEYGGHYYRCRCPACPARDCKCGHTLGGHMEYHQCLVADCNCDHFQP